MAMYCLMAVDVAEFLLAVGLGVAIGIKTARLR